MLLLVPVAVLLKVVRGMMTVLPHAARVPLRWLIAAGL